MTRFPGRPFMLFAACTSSLLLGTSRAPAEPQTTVVVAAPSPYWGYTYAPYLGVGDIIRARGDFLIKKEEAALLREDVRQKKLETHRKQLEHWEWVRDFRAGALNRQEQSYRDAQVKFNADYASRAEIYRAAALNRLKNDF